MDCYKNNEYTEMLNAYMPLPSTHLKYTLSALGVYIRTNTPLVIIRMQKYV